MSHFFWTAKSSDALSCRKSWLEGWSLHGNSNARYKITILKTFFFFAFVVAIKIMWDCHSELVISLPSLDCLL